MSNETFVAFATQKGGIGKSTVTALAANYLHNVKGHNVAVIDCDAPQHSIHGLRERETGLIGGSLYFKALACDHFRKIRKNAYPVIASDALNALDDAERMLAAEEVKPDVVFFDMPGTLKSNGVVKTLSQMDYIFAPMSADRFVVESTLQFAVMFRDNLMTTGQAKTKGLYLFWTMVDGREKNGLYDLYEDVIAEMGLSVLSTRLPDSKKFRRDLSEERKGVFRSTIFPMDTSLLKGSGIREFSEEIAASSNRDEHGQQESEHRRHRRGTVDSLYRQAQAGRNPIPRAEAARAGPRRRKRSRIGTAVRTVTGKGETAERQRTPQTAGGRLHRTVPAPQRDKDTPVRLYQPGRTQQDS